MHVDPSTDPQFVYLKTVATGEKGEYGEHFDRGILSVISEIEQTGKYIPNYLAEYIIQKSQPDGSEIIASLFSPEEVQVLEREMTARGLTTAAAVVHFARGVRGAQITLKRYSAGAKSGWIDSTPSRGVAIDPELPWLR